MFIPEEENVVLEDNTNDYINQIQKLKENSVSRDDYNKLKADNKRLIEALSNGENLGEKVEPQEDPVEKIKKLRKGLQDRECNLNDLNFIKNVLDLRTEVIKQGGTDPALPIGHNVRITDSDIEGVNRVGRILGECVEDSDNDNNLFIAEVRRRLN